MSLKMHKLILRNEPAEVLSYKDTQRTIKGTNAILLFFIWGSNNFFK